RARAGRQPRTRGPWRGGASAGAPPARARAEALAKRRGEPGRIPVELLGEADEPCKVGLPRLFPLAELLRRTLEPALSERDPPHGLAGLPAVALQRDPCVAELLFEVGGERVRADQHRLLLERHAGPGEVTDPADHVRVRAELGRRPVAERRAQCLLRATEA